MVEFQHPVSARSARSADRLPVVPNPAPLIGGLGCGRHTGAARDIGPPDHHIGAHPASKSEAHAISKHSSNGASITGTPHD